MRMDSETLELLAEGRQDNHSWCIGVFSHSFGWVEAGIEEMVGMHAGQSQEWLVACGEMLVHFPCAG